MTEVIREVEGPNGGIMAVILILVIAIGGFLIWRFSANTSPKETNDTINLNVTPPAIDDTNTGN